MNIFVTGVAGFIGYHLSKELLKRGNHVIGIDNINDYYDPWFKYERLKNLESEKNFQFHKMALEDFSSLKNIFQKNKFDRVVHLAAQAGVRYSIQNPFAYVQSNLVGFQNVLELVRNFPVSQLVYASSSSVYGGNKQMPFSESQDVSNPISLYAATKLSNEIVARSYFNMYGISSVGLRFFTVYGPCGRPDMAMFKFSEAIMREKPIPIFNYGKSRRDFTFCADIVDGIIRSMDAPKGCRVYNLGKGQPENLMDLVKLIEELVSKKGIYDFQPMQIGDVEETWADVSLAHQEIGYQPKTSMQDGVPQLVKWFVDEAWPHIK